MLCPDCQTLNDEKATSCVDCGADLTALATDDEEIVITHGGLGVAGVIGILSIVILGVWLLVQFVLLPMINGGNVIGEYSLDHREVEASIVVGIFDDTGVDASAICPEQMRGTVGATFSCQVDIDGLARVARVTINDGGKFSWAVVN